MIGERIERFLPILSSLPERIDVCGPTGDALTLDEDGPIRVVWVPFEYIPDKPVIARVGITPGRYQAERALIVFRDAIRDGSTVEQALRRVKALASFSGPMRANLVAMLDHIGLAQVLGIKSCSDLFGAIDEPVHFTSALRYPIFINGVNYSGSPDIIGTKILRRWVDTTLAEEVRLLPGVIWVPLGPKPAQALDHLAAQGLVERSRILNGLPHPSGANAERVAFFLGRKPRMALSRQTRPDAIEEALIRLRNQAPQLARPFPSAVSD